MSARGAEEGAEEARKPRYVVVLVWLVPLYLLAAILCGLVRPEWPSLIAPLAGPWAGHLYGHSSCTMSSVFPTLSRGLAASLPVLILLGWLGRRYAAAFLPLLLWALAWMTLAWMSVVNSTS